MKTRFGYGDIVKLVKVEEHNQKDLAQYFSIHDISASYDGCTQEANVLGFRYTATPTRGTRRNYLDNGCLV